jgi:hypothetical protein
MCRRVFDGMQQYTCTIYKAANLQLTLCDWLTDWATQVAVDVRSGPFPNLWLRRWGASFNDDPISFCASCGCFVQPPVADRSYLDLDHINEVCYSRKPCYYNAYAERTNSDHRPSFAQPPSADLAWSSADIKRCRPPRRWWSTYEHQVELPPPADYSKLRPRSGTLSCYSRFEIGEVSNVNSQWIP